MINIGKLLEELNKTPLASWEKTNYRSPEILVDVNQKICDLINKLDKEKIGGSDTTKVYAAGGFVSDLIISEIHQSKFAPKDIDFFVPAMYLDHIIYPYVKSEYIEITEEEMEEIKLKGESYSCENGKYYLKTEEKNSWDFFGEKLKEIFPKVVWNDRTTKGYEFAEINVVYYIEYKGYLIELVVGEDDRILNFDMSFRCVYFNNGNIYVNSYGLEDIKEKKLRILHSETPISTCLRMLDFQERYGFEIDSLSLMILLHSINNKMLSYGHFLETMRNHKKYNPNLEKLFLKIPHEREVFAGNEMVPETSIIKFDLSYFEEFNEDMVDVYNQCNEVLCEKGSIVFPKLEVFLKNYNKIEFNFERPKNWYKAEIFENSLLFKKDFMDWYKEKSLQITFNGSTKSEPKLSSEEMAFLYDSVVSDAKIPKNGGLSEFFESYVPLIAYNKEWKISLDPKIIKELIFDGLVNVYIDTKNIIDRPRQSFLIDNEKKKITFLPMGLGTYFGLVGDLYEDFTNQIKKALGIEDYEVEGITLDSLRKLSVVPNLEEFYKCAPEMFLEDAKKKEKIAIL